MIATHGALMPPTGMHRRWRCRIRMRMRCAGIIGIRIGAARPRTIANSTRDYPRMIPCRTRRMHTTRRGLRHLRIFVRVRCAGVIPVCVCACLSVAIGHRTRGYPCMIATRGALMPPTGMHRRWIRMRMRCAGIIGIRIGAARPRTIANSTRCH